ncbi:MAG TPA: hypothetical protein VGR85_15640 [Candidatus Limnocylindria bacterium]|jgi:hypothetical protein|nr:hypothetical protein [Candidatus Limnocylindria bacterium]
MYRWEISYSGRALRPHRTITGTFNVKAAAIHTAAQRGASRISEKDGTVIVALNIRVTRLARELGAHPIRSDSDPSTRPLSELLRF